MPPKAEVAARKLHGEIVGGLEQAAGRAARKSKSQVHQKPITSYGLYEEEGRAVFKQAMSGIATLSLSERFALARLLLKSHIEEQGHLAMAVLRTGLHEITPKHFDQLDKLLDDFTSWSIVDDFATGKGSITAFLLSRNPKETLRLHEQWVRSSNMWKRRASVVTFTRKTASGGGYVGETLRFCEALMYDTEELVQKGVGWALKDTIRAGPAAKRRVLALVKRMRREGLPSTIRLYAIRDLRGAERAAILKINAKMS